MRKIGAILAACVAGLGLTAEAQAADVVPPAPPVLATPVVPPDPAFDWNRFYAGIQTGLWFDLGPIAYDSFRAAISAGRNVVTGDRFVVGVEAVGGFYVYPGEVLFEAYGLARTGVVLGERVLPYAAVGVGFDFDPIGGGGFMVAGGGVEVGVGDSLGLRGEVLALRYFGEPFTYLSATIGLNWHFGR